MPHGSLVSQENLSPIVSTTEYLRTNRENFHLVKNPLGAGQDIAIEFGCGTRNKHPTDFRRSL